MFLLNFVKFCSPKILYDHDFQNALISLLNYITVTKQNMTIINGRKIPCRDFVAWVTISNCNFLKIWNVYSWVILLYLVHTSKLRPTIEIG